MKRCFVPYRRSQKIDGLSDCSARDRTSIGGLRMEIGDGVQRPGRSGSDVRREGTLHRPLPDLGDVGLNDLSQATQYSRGIDRTVWERNDNCF
jgi:hypothetical protein